MILGFAASNSSIRPRSDPSGSSGSHHCENSRVTVPPPPPPLAPSEPPEPPPHAATSAMAEAAATTAEIRRPAMRRPARAPLLMSLQSKKDAAGRDHLRVYAVLCKSSIDLVRGQEPDQAYPRGRNVASVAESTRKALGARERPPAKSQIPGASVLFFASVCCRRVRSRHRRGGAPPARRAQGRAGRLCRREGAGDGRPARRALRRLRRHHPARPGPARHRRRSHPHARRRDQPVRRPPTGHRVGRPGADAGHGEGHHRRHGRRPDPRRRVTAHQRRDHDAGAHPSPARSPRPDHRDQQPGNPRGDRAEDLPRPVRLRRRGSPVSAGDGRPCHVPGAARR